MKNECSGCGKNFTCGSAFDKHRIGSFSKRTRHCMTTEQMLKAGLIQNSKGDWGWPSSEYQRTRWQKKEESAV